MTNSFPICSFIFLIILIVLVIYWNFHFVSSNLGTYCTILSCRWFPDNYHYQLRAEYWCRLGPFCASYSSLLLFHSTALSQNLCVFSLHFSLWLFTFWIIKEDRKSCLEALYPTVTLSVHAAPPISLSSQSGQAPLLQPLHEVSFRYTVEMERGFGWMRLPLVERDISWLKLEMQTDSPCPCCPRKWMS